MGEKITELLAPLNTSVLQAACVNRVIGRKICVLQKISSTNDVALEWGEREEKEGAVVFAESQTAGRGQFGRSWHSSSRHGIWCSILLRPNFSPRAAAYLTPLATMAVACALHQTIGIRPSLKLPNDLYFLGGKVCGILTEARTGSQFFAVIGIGINVNQEEFPPMLQGIATSLRKETGKLYNRTQVARTVLLEMNRLYDSMGHGFEEIQSLYESWPRYGIPL